MLRVRNNRLIYLLLALLMALLVTGCGGGTKEMGPGVSNSETEVKVDDLLAKGKSLSGLTYDYVATFSGEQINSKVWVKEGNMRIEMIVPEAGKMISIINTQKNAVYSYSPEQNMATKIPLDQSEVDTISPQDYSENMNSESMKYIKNETLDGKKCLIYEVSDQDEKVKVWLWEDYGIPLRVEASDEGMLVEYKNIKVEDIDDSLFVLPVGINIMDLGNLNIP